MKPLVIFDNDGTLVDTENVSTASLSEMAAELGLDIPPHVAKQRFTGRHTADCFAELSAESGQELDPAWLEMHAEKFVARIEHELTIMPHIDWALAQLDCAICIGSNAGLDHVERCLRISGLDRFFAEHHRFSAYMFDAWKPEPTVFLEAAKAMGYPPEHCAVVEDSAVGMQAGVSAGMTVFGYIPEGMPTGAPTHGVIYYDDHRTLPKLIKDHLN
ncbi:MAG: HAD-IA family hydrolase [Gammaproteobacteria bacterium]|nr:HAD-IA family hydrolase [Gammaproteobacteria bacterium]